MGFTCDTNKTQVLLGCIWPSGSVVVTCDTNKTQASDTGIMALWLLPVTPIRHRPQIQVLQGCIQYPETVTCGTNTHR